MQVSMEPSSYQLALSMGRDSVEGELSLTDEEDSVDVVVVVVVAGNDGKGKFSMPTLTGRMMVDFCSPFETGTMSRSVGKGKKEKKKK